MAVALLRVSQFMLVSDLASQGVSLSGKRTWSADTGFKLWGILLANCDLSIHPFAYLVSSAGDLSRTHSC